MRRAQLVLSAVLAVAIFNNYVVTVSGKKGKIPAVPAPVTPEEDAKQALADKEDLKRELRKGDFKKKMDGAKLYFKLKGTWNETGDVDQPMEPDSIDAPQHGAGKHHAGRKDCPVQEFPRGCVSNDKLAGFLDDKWIPGFEASSDVRFVEAGHFFEGREPKPLPSVDHKGRPVPVPDIMPVSMGTLMLMHEFALYLLSRPEAAVPDQVRPYFNPPGKPWPGSMGSSREPYLPPQDARKELCTPPPSVCMPFHEQDIEAAAAPLKSEHDLLVEEREEEGELANSAAFRQIFYLSMALMGLVVPASIGYFCVRSYLNTKASYQPPQCPTMNRPDLENSRVDDLRNKLLSSTPAYPSHPSFPMGGAPQNPPVYQAYGLKPPMMTNMPAPHGPRW